MVTAMRMSSGVRVAAMPEMVVLGRETSEDASDGGIERIAPRRGAHHHKWHDGWPSGATGGCRDRRGIHQRPCATS